MSEECRIMAKIPADHDQKNSNVEDRIGAADKATGRTEWPALATQTILGIERV